MTMLPRIWTERTLCRLAEPSEADKVLEYFKRSGKRYDPPVPDEMLNLEDWERYTLRAIRDYLDKTRYQFFLFDKAEAEVIGTVGLGEVTRGVRFDCTLSYGISGDLEGQGYMKEALSGVIAFAFAELNLHRIEAAYAPTNERSGALLKKLGFQTIGEVPGYQYSHGGWRSTILTSLVNPNWTDPGQN
jgi:[ribosomal protein S5]-alanine N-acetyltransferase